MSGGAARLDGGDSTPGSDTGERITRLFPKCRPRGLNNNMQHHHDRLNSGLEPRHSDTNNINSVLSSDEELVKENSDGNQVVILNAKGGTYKLRDSRIIEIAGGRELYSQSRSKVSRKMRHGGGAYKHNLRNKLSSIADYNDTFHNDNIVQRLSNNETKKMISKQTSPSFVNGDRPMKRTEKNTSYMNQHQSVEPHVPVTTVNSQKGSPIAVVADGEVVVLDDISDDWKGLRLDLECDNDNEMKRSIDNINGLNSLNTMDRSLNISPDVVSDQSIGSDDDTPRVRRVIGDHSISDDQPTLRRGRIGEHSIDDDQRRHRRGVMGDHSVDEDPPRLRRGLMGDHSVNDDQRRPRRGIMGDHSVDEDQLRPRRGMIGDHGVDEDLPRLRRAVIGEHCVDEDQPRPRRGVIVDHGVDEDYLRPRRAVIEDYAVDEDPPKLRKGQIGDLSVDEDQPRLRKGHIDDHSVDEDQPGLRKDLIGDHCVDENQSRLTRVIGELPIAEYEGSPRRYGVGPQLTSAKSPRPGFPQRVVSDSRDVTPPSSSAAFDYLYEFSETRKVLEEFFRCPAGAGQTQLPSGTTEEIINFQELDYSLRRQQQACSPEPHGASPESGELSPDSSWRARRPAPPPRRLRDLDSPNTQNHTNFLGLQQNEIYHRELNVVELSVGTGSSGSVSPGVGASAGRKDPAVRMGLTDPQPPLQFGLSPETTDCDSNCGDLDSEVSLMIMENEILELKGLAENARSGVNTVSMPVVEDGLSSGHASDTDNNNAIPTIQNHTSVIIEEIVENGTCAENHVLSDADLHSLDPLASSEVSPPPPAPAPHRPPDEPPPPPDLHPSPHPHDPLWPSRKRPNSAESTESVERKPTSGDEDEADTDLETDRLLGQQRTDDQGFFDDKGWRKPKSRTLMPAVGSAGASSGASATARSPPHQAPLPPNAVPHPPPLPTLHTLDDTDTLPINNSKDKEGKKKGKNKEVSRHAPAVLIEGVLFRARYLGSTQLACEGQPTKATRMLQAEEAVSRIKAGPEGAEAGAGADGGAYSGVYAAAPAAVFRLTFLGSVEVDEDGPARRRKKRLKKNMVEEAVTKIKAPEGENQPSTEVDLFISTEKIMVLNTELKEIMMDHALRTISYIADIGDLVVLMARRRFVPHDSDSDPPKLNRTPKMICHVFESEEAQFIAQSIGQAFQVAYMEFLKANGIEDHSFVKEMDYQEVLNSQEIFGDELQMFAKKELQKDVVVPKTKGEILGVVVVESGWGSMLPTVVIANLAPAGAAARCGHVNIGDQIIAINGVSLVGLPLSTCQAYIKNSKTQTVVKLTVVPCAPVVEVKIKRPDTKYQLGFSVQNGVICSLLRGGIAERGGVRVGHRIIEINSQSVVAVPHERIVNLLATSVGEILMKTMPTSMFRLLTGQENPIYI